MSSNHMLYNMHMWIRADFILQVLQVCGKSMSQSLVHLGVLHHALAIVATNCAQIVSIITATKPDRELTYNPIGKCYESFITQ
jgi:hypothetical protein